MEVLAMRKVNVQTQDEFVLAAHVLDHVAPHATVLIPAAMGVKQDYYFAFARWLHEQGYTVATFDYRGMGLSRPPQFADSLKGFEADLLDWAADYEAMLHWLKAHVPHVPLYVIGHSLGAQLAGLAKNKGLINGMVSIAAGSGYWRMNAPPTKRVVLYFWYVLVPLATRWYGYFPGKRFKKVGDLPKGAMLQWRKWCLDPLYSVGAEGEHAKRAYGEARFPILALSITDDEMMTLEGTQSLVDFYHSAPREIQRIAPKDIGVHRIGHFGFFREQFAGLLWPKIPAVLQTFAQPSRS
jgi:predicted alpha/beta hydrolase